MMEKGVTSNGILAVVVGVLAIILAILLFTGGSSTGTSSSEVQSIVVSNKTISLSVGDKYTIAAIVSPSNAADKSLTYMSNNTFVASVDTSGNVTANNPGTAKISVTSKNGKQDECTVTVVDKKILVTSITLDKDDVTLTEGESITLKTRTSPSNATEHSFTWTSSDSSVASVDSNGKVTAKKAGSTLITVMTSNKKIAICDIEVRPKVVTATGIAFNVTSKTIKEGQTFALTVTFTPSDTTNKTLTWETSNANIATVSSKGVVVGKGDGTATITAKTSNGKTASAKITVEVDAFKPITEIPSMQSGFTTIASYNSSTLKYRIQHKGSADYVLVWVKDAYNQLNSALPEVGKAFAPDETLGREISTYGYQSKGMVATNGGFFWDGWGDSPCVPFIMNKGRILRDIENKKYGRVYGFFGLTKAGILKSYSFSSDNYSANVASKNQVLADGVRNSWSYVMMPVNEGALLTPDSGRDSTNRTMICQVDKNNFVLYSGSGLSIYGAGKELKETFGCVRGFNLDGGGSRKLYYKTATMSSMTRRFGGDRKVPDYLYFVEK